jgi:hypothetical protein
VLALALIKALAVLFRLPAAAPASRRGITAATAGGAVLAGLTCLVI